MVLTTVTTIGFEEAIWWETSSTGHPLQSHNPTHKGESAEGVPWSE